MKIWMATAFAATDELLELCVAADQHGYHGVTFSDHLFYAEAQTSQYPYTPDGKRMWQHDTPWPDPWVTIGALSSITTQLRFTTNVYIAPARDLFSVAKQVSTAAVLSGGRVELGVGAGWSRDEFDQTGQRFEDRGPRLNEMIDALRELWQPGWAAFHGEHYDFDKLTLEPTPPGPIPINVGGHSKPALRRVAQRGDGWIGTYYKPDEIDGVLAELSAALAVEGRDLSDVEVLLSPIAVPSVDYYRELEDKGVDGIVWAPWMLADVTDERFASPLEARIEATERFADEIIARL